MASLIAVVVLVVGVLLIWGGRGIRRHRGLGQGRTIELDDRNLFSRRYGLMGRPDRIIAGGIPEEWKSSNRIHDSHRAQLAAYFLLIEDETGVAPPHGFIVTGDGQRHRIENTPELRDWVLDVAEQIRAARRLIGEPILMTQPAGKCRGCSMRDGCSQRSD